MSSFADNMDHGNSNRSLLSERGSDMGSSYVIESGFYISSFAATIFISGIAVAGVLLLSLIVSLVVMLQSCQNQHSSIFQEWKKDYVYDYCSIVAFHKELNNLESEEFPAVCKAYVTSYMNEVLMDIDDILPTNIINKSRFPQYRNETEEAKGRAQGFVRRLYIRLQTAGWSLILFTRKPESQRNGTVGSLIAAGYEGWSSLIMRSTDELSMGSREYIAGRRAELQDQGFTIASVISSRMDALTGPSTGKRNFKLASGHWL